MGHGLIVRRSFDAAHWLPGYPGDCKHLHGHTWYVDVELVGELNEVGFLIDFKDAKKIIDGALPDHRCINDHYRALDDEEFMPTAENLSERLFTDLAFAFSVLPPAKANVRVRRVTVWETPTNGATYEPD